MANTIGITKWSEKNPSQVSLSSPSKASLPSHYLFFFYIFYLPGMSFKNLGTHQLQNFRVCRVINFLNITLFKICKQTSVRFISEIPKIFSITYRDLLNLINFINALISYGASISLGIFWVGIFHPVTLSGTVINIHRFD